MDTCLSEFACRQQALLSDDTDIGAIMIIMMMIMKILLLLLLLLLQ